MSGWEQVAQTAWIPAGSGQTVTAACPVGKLPFGGGFTKSGEVDVESSIPVNDSESGWLVSFNNASGGEAYVLVYAICGYGS